MTTQKRTEPAENAQPTEPSSTVPTQRYTDQGTSVTPTTDPTAELDADSEALTGDDDRG
jgi:hypothetical protein